MGNAVRLGSRSGLSFLDSDFQKWIGARPAESRRPHVSTTRDFVWMSDVGESWVTLGEPTGQRLCHSVPDKCHKRRDVANTLVFPARVACHFQAHVSQTDGFTPPARRIAEGT